MTEPERPTHADSLCARPPEIPPSGTSPLVPGIDLASVYRVDSLDQIDDIYAGRTPGYFYARDGHRNASQIASKFAAIEGSESAFACGSGMAATSAILLALCGQGDHVVLADQVYGKTGVLVRRELARFGVESTSFDSTDPSTLDAALRPGTRLVLAETITNPLVRVTDLPVLARICRDRGTRLVVDHTFAPLLCRPLELGASLVYHSATKLIGGHSDVTLGLIAGPRELIDRIAPVSSTFGLSANPFDCWMALRGLSTLALRVERAAANALELARRLSADPRVAAVHYPGLESHPDHTLASGLLSGRYGAMMCLDLSTRERADALIRRLRHIPFAPSLGDVATTLSHPSSTSHRTLSPDDASRQGIHPGLVRLSVGLEHPDDLWADFDQALPA